MTNSTASVSGSVIIWYTVITSISEQQTISQRITNVSVSQTVAVSNHQSAVHGRFQNLSQYTSEAHTHARPKGRLHAVLTIQVASVTGVSLSGRPCGLKLTVYESVRFFFLSSIISMFTFLCNKRWRCCLHYCHCHVVWGPICSASCVDGIPPVTGRDRAPLLERLVD